MGILYCSWGENAMEDAKEALMSLDSNVKIHLCPVRDYLSGNCEVQLKKQFTSEVETVFSFDFLPIVSRMCQERNVRYISWVYDWPNYTVFAPEVYNPCNKVFLFEPDGVEELKRRGVQNVFYMPLAVNSKRLDRLLLKNPKKMEYEVSFVGNLYLGKKEALFSDAIPAYYSGFVDALVNAQQKIYGYNLIHEIVDRNFTANYFHAINGQLSGMPVEDSYVLACQIDRLVTGVERRNLLQAAARNGKTHLFTQSDVADLENVILHKGVDYMTEMPRVFSDSKINLNFTLRSITSGIPLRVFDILGAGGFCLTNYQRAIEEHFVDGEDLVMFSSVEDMEEKIRYYLEHDEERERIAAQGRKKVGEYNYHTALTQMFS